MTVPEQEPPVRAREVVLASLQRQLDELSPDAFLAEWGAAAAA